MKIWDIYLDGTDQEYGSACDRHVDEVEDRLLEIWLASGEIGDDTPISFMLYRDEMAACSICHCGEEDADE